MNETLPLCSVCTWLLLEKSYIDWFYFKFLTTDLTWVLTTALEFYCVSLMHQWDFLSLQTVNWSHLPAYKSADLSWHPSFCPYVIAEEVSLLLLGVHFPMWSLDSFISPTQRLHSFRFPFFCVTHFTLSFRLFLSPCKHVLASPILKDMPLKVSPPPLSSPFLCSPLKIRLLQVKLRYKYKCVYTLALFTEKA